MTFEDGVIPGRTVREQLADAIDAHAPRCCEPRCSAPATVRITYSHHFGLRGRVWLEEKCCAPHTMERYDAHTTVIDVSPL